MSFHSSAQDIQLNGSVLRARLTNSDGELRDAEINLNDILGNQDGHFSWGTSNFYESAEDVRLSFEGGDNLPIIRANLRTADGNAREADVNLSERLSNINGDFSFE